MIPDDTPSDASEEAVSLDGLAQAFAQVLGTAPKPGIEPSSTSPFAATVDEPHDAGLAEAESPPEDDASGPVDPRSILEAMLFVGDRENRPLTPARAAELMRGVAREEIPALVQELNDGYLRHGAPYFIADDPDGYRMRLRKAFEPLQQRFYGRIREARLSQAAIDILAIVAYQQPLSAEQINTLRGKPSSHVLSQLVRRGLLRIERSQGKKRTVKYFTTDRFLSLFGLQTLADLPQSEELERK